MAPGYEWERQYVQRLPFHLVIFLMFRIWIYGLEKCIRGEIHAV